MATSKRFLRCCLIFKVSECIDYDSGICVKSTMIYMYISVPNLQHDYEIFPPEEIEASCQNLDWSSARLKSYEPDHIETEVNCQFDCPPTNYDESGRNREQVLLTIARVIDKNNVTFAIPAINYVNNEP